MDAMRAMGAMGAMGIIVTTYRVRVTCVTPVLHVLSYCRKHVCTLTGGYSYRRSVWLPYRVRHSSKHTTTTTHIYMDGVILHRVHVYVYIG